MFSFSVWMVGMGGEGVGGVGGGGFAEVAVGGLIYDGSSFVDMICLRLFVIICHN